MLEIVASGRLRSFSTGRKDHCHKMLFGKDRFFGTLLRQCFRNRYIRLPVVDNDSAASYPLTRLVTPFPRAISFICLLLLLGFDALVASCPLQ